MYALDLKALEVFRTVALEGSVTRAANKLNRVQSNVSTRIKQLEQELDQQLFLRINRGLQLTPSGETLLAYSERLLALSSEATEAMNQSEPQGVLRIGTMESTAAARLPEVLADYHQRYPLVTIELQTATAGRIVDCLQAHSVDCGFIAEPFDIEGFEKRKVFTEELVLVMPASYAQVSRLSQLKGKTLIAFEVGCAYRRHLEHCLKAADIEPGSVISLGSYLAILACVSAGTGFAIVPRSVLDVIETSQQLRILPLPKRYAQVDTVLVWRSGFASAKIKAVEALLHKLPDVSI